MLGKQQADMMPLLEAALPRPLRSLLALKATFLWNDDTLKTTGPFPPYLKSANTNLRESIRILE